MERPPVLPGLFDPPIASALSPLARHCSALGAQDAAKVSDRQSLALLSLYQTRGPLTDQEAADALGLQRNSINARRNSLIKLKLVDERPKGTRKNEVTGISNATWGLK